MCKYRLGMHWPENNKGLGKRSFERFSDSTFYGRYLIVQRETSMKSQFFCGNIYHYAENSYFVWKKSNFWRAPSEEDNIECKWFFNIWKVVDITKKLVCVFKNSWCFWRYLKNKKLTGFYMHTNIVFRCPKTATRGVL